MQVSSGSLKGRVGIVTGGGRGIGAAIVKELRDLGAEVVALDLSPDGSAASRTVVADVRILDDVAKVADEVHLGFGRLDFLVANAGVTDRGTLADGDPEQWRKVIETNVLGVAHSVRAAVPALAAKGHGHVVIVSSISGRMAYIGEPLYIASKWALVGLGHALRKELRAAGLHVSLVEPGIVDTPLVSETQEGREELAQLRPLDAATSPVRLPSSCNSPST